MGGVGGAREATQLTRVAMKTEVRGRGVGVWGERERGDRGSEGIEEIVWLSLVMPWRGKGRADLCARYIISAAFGGNVVYLFIFKGGKTVLNETGDDGIMVIKVKRYLRLLSCWSLRLP